MNNDTVETVIKEARIIFWDFDGVIKDSVPVKTESFRKLFSPFGSKVTEKVVAHHLANGGVSRHKKIPYYFKHYVGSEISQEEADWYANKFSKLVVDKVINSPWIPGAEDYLCRNPNNQVFILVTGTPQQEIESILEKLGLEKVFAAIHGSPEEKTRAVAIELEKNNWKKSACILIGDSSTDYKAAQKNNICFIFRGQKNAMPDSIYPVYIMDNFLTVFLHV